MNGFSREGIMIPPTDLHWRGLDGKFYRVLAICLGVEATNIFLEDIACSPCGVIGEEGGWVYVASKAPTVRRKRRVRT